MTQPNRANADSAVLQGFVLRELAAIIDHLDNWPLRKPSLGDMRGIANRLDTLHREVQAYPVPKKAP